MPQENCERVGDTPSGECGSEEAIDPSFLKEALGCPKVLRGHREELSSLLAMLDRAKASSCGQMPPVAQRLEKGTLDILGSLLPTRGQETNRSRFFYSVKKKKKGLFRIQGLDWPPSERMCSSDLERGEIAKKH